MPQGNSCTLGDKTCILRQAIRSLAGANTLPFPFACTVAASGRKWWLPCTGKAVATTSCDRGGKKMKLVIAAGLVFTTSLLAIDKEPAKRLGEAASVFSEIMAAPDKGIPQDLLEKAYCIVIVPSVKTAAFVVGGKYGKGYLSCRNKSGSGWSAPATVRIEGGSVGFQIGGSMTDLIMLVMSEGGADKLLSSKFTLGGEASVAAGPVGRTATAQTDAQMHAEILSWSRSQGLFAGIALEGATLREDLDDNATLYGKRLENRDIVTHDRPAPKSAAPLMALLNKYSAMRGH
jgi:lipid-binding SYLF domain-containing protein